jgi:UTP--glucose-1-phosphate uridylyltransferase
MLFFQYPVRHLRRFRRRAAHHFASYTIGPATKTMWNEINRLIDSVSDPVAQKVYLSDSYNMLLLILPWQAFAAEMQGFIHLFKRFVGEGPGSERLSVLVFSILR